MCFSPLASFITAAVTGAIGIAAVTQARRGRMGRAAGGLRAAVEGMQALPLAATPLIFALQQTIEGLLWLNLEATPDGSASGRLTFLFLFFAQGFWPVYAPLAVLLVEPSLRRRRLMALCLAAGAGVASYLLWYVLGRPHGALIVDDHVVYVTETRYSAWVSVAYLAATCLPLILSSQRTIVVLGAVVLVGCLTAYGFYWDAFVSVWCYFAAAASVVILGHFELTRRHRLTLAAP